MAEKKLTLKLPEPHSDKQKLLFSAFLHPGVREIWCCCGTKFGKACYIGELIPTPDGFKFFGMIKEGDYVFDEHGNPTKVIYSTDIMYGHECYEVTFSDDQRVICDEEHLWLTETHLDRKNKARNENYVPNKPIKTTKEILETLTYKEKRPNHSIPLVSAPVMYPRRNLLIDPYVMGAWLGDGSRYGGSFTTDDIQIIKEIEKSGFYVKKNIAAFTYCIHGLEGLLKKYNLIKNKHIPPDYLIASPSQRLALLQGLMDTDGTISKRGDSCFDNTNLDLVDGVDELVRSLGIKTKRGSRPGRLKGKEYKICYRVYFTTDLPIFRLKRKLSRIRKITIKSKKRYITSIKKVPSVPVKCIEVENKSHLYLIGTGFIPTHNTLGAVMAQAVIALKRPGTKHRWVAPIYAQTRQPLEYFRKILPKPPHSKHNKSTNMIELPKIETRVEFWHSQSPSSLEGDGIHSYVFDEAARQPKEIRESARTTLTKTKGPSIYISYPFGKNWFFDGCMEAEESMIWSLKNGKAPEKLFFHARTRDNPGIDPQIIENARRELSSKQYRQFYEAEFLEDGAVFPDPTPCIFGERLDVRGDRQEWIDYHASKSHVIVAADWAKTNDYTVFIALDMLTCRVIGFHRSNKVNYTEQVRNLAIFCRKFETIEMILHDKTGVGIAIDEQLAYISRPYRGITFTNELKCEFVLKLTTAFEQKQILIPNWPQLLKELKCYEGIPNKIGTITYGGHGEHDDIVTALFLAYYGYLIYGDNNFGVKYLDELSSGTEEKSDLEKFYLDLAEDDES